MADQLNMNGLSLNDSKHANGGPNGRPTYIPPHLRGQQVRAGPSPMDGPATLSPTRSNPLSSPGGNTLSPGNNPGLGGSAWGNTK